MGKTTIEWTDRRWNPVRGCSRISPGCLNCYAEKIAARFSDPGQPFHLFADRKPKAHWTGKVELIEDKLLDPLSWREPCRCFVNSMSDLFHADLPDEARDRIFAVMALCPHVTFQCLTKRGDVMDRYMSDSQTQTRIYDIIRDEFFCEACNRIGWKSTYSYVGDMGDRPCYENELYDPFIWPLPNVHLGVSVENQEQADKRIPHLLRTPAAVRFLSCEPLLGPLDLYRGGFTFLNAIKSPAGVKYPGLDWVIVGGESGPGARPCNLKWIRSIVRQCKAAGVPAFVKQLGSKPVGPCARCGGAGTIITWEDGMPGGAECPKCCYGNKEIPLRLKNKKGGDMSEWPEDIRIREFPEVR